ncbi:MFS general substrate transporter [Glonium stellatum]|uniref:MFS general substrate transporter n=1 Tax=Glonium stellatum TaxID=574774 RepID=A0A8E2EWC5_9PEZI|nr:MFS general substrate transporter [Glonium stellatum]
MADERDEPSKPVKLLTRIPEELGLVSLYKSPLDTKLLCIQRFVRLFAYGGSTLILVSYLRALDISDRNIGLFMTLTLVGDVIISFFLTLVADGLGRKTILSLGAALMVVSGVIFGLSGNYLVLLAAAIFGVISPSGNEIGPFRAIEESTIAHLSPPAVRPDIFAWYSLIGTAGTAFGLMTCGWVTHTLQSKKGWDDIRAYRAIFFGYAVLGAVKLVLALALSKKCEVEKEVAPQRDSEAAPLLANGDGQGQKQKKKRSILPSISKESRGIFVKLAILFALDSFASGLAPLSWVTNFFKRKFNLQEGYLGSLFFTTSIISAASMLVAASIAKRIGNVKTMVFTHFPSAAALALIGIPNSLPFAMLFLVLRACTQSMDVAPRSAFLAAAVLPKERTAVMGAINVVKTSSQSLGPLITGVLVGKNLFWLAFLMAGCLKGTYDMGMLAVFAGHKSKEEQEQED